MQLEYLFYFTKAYDVINRNILLDKLNYYGITAITKLRCISHLAHWEQFVEINEIGCRYTIRNKYISSYRKIKHAVLPLLFLLHINNLLLNIQVTNLILFADNTNLLISEKDESVFQYKIKNVMKKLEILFQRITLW